MSREFFHWWGQGLHALLPGRGSAGGRAGGPPLVAAADGPDADGIALSLRRRGAERELGRFGPGAADAEAMRRALRAAKRAPLALRLPAAVLLERDIALPLSAEPELAGALAYEIDRVSPFRPEEVFWSWEVVRRDRGRGRLHLRLLLAPRSAAERTIARLAAAGARPALLEGPGMDGVWRRIPLAGTGWSVPQRRALRVAAFACAGLSLAAAAAPFLRQSRQAAEVEAGIAALRPAAHEAEALRERLERAAAGGDAVQAALAEIGSAVGALAAVTAVLPDDTFLTELSLKQRRLALRGQSSNAARLIAELSAHAAFRDPAFSAPVTRAAVGGRLDVFAIAAELAPDPQERP